MLSGLHTTLHQFSQPFWNSPILQKRKWRLWNVTQGAQGHPANKTRGCGPGIEAVPLKGSCWHCALCVTRRCGVTVGFWKLRYGEMGDLRNRLVPKTQFSNYECRTLRPQFTNGKGSAAKFMWKLLTSPQTHTFQVGRQGQKGSWDCFWSHSHPAVEGDFGADALATTLRRYTIH